MTLTGGAIYHAALSDVLHNIDEDDATDRALLDLTLQIDRLLAEQGETHYAVAVAEKPPALTRKVRRVWQRMQGRPGEGRARKRFISPQVFNEDYDVRRGVARVLPQCRHTKPPAM